MEPICTTWTVSIAFEWQKKYKEEHTGSTYTFASLRGCKEFIEKQRSKEEKYPEDKILWYCIKGLDHFPCDKNEPWGQTYQGLVYHDFWELEDSMKL